MVAALSSAMSRSLLALIDVNNQMEATQNRINTGKAVNDPSDNIAIYFKARSYSDKAELYDTVNASITQATANLDYVDKALSNMIDNVKGARQILNDAKAKSVVQGTAVSLTGTKAYAQTTITVGGTARTIKGQIVDVAKGDAAAPNLSDGAFFQAGDVFRVDFRDASNNSTATRYFRAVAPDATNAPDQSGSGDRADTAIEFNDLASLATAMNLGFGRANASFDLVANSATNPTNYKLKMTLRTASQSITFGQVVDQSVTKGTGDTAVTSSGSTFDFSKLLQPPGADGAAVTLGNALEAGAASAGSWTYASNGGTQTDQSAVDARRQAADFFRQAIYGLQATVRDASLPGFANVLRGEAMTVSLNDTNTVSQTVKLATPIDFSGSNVGANPYGVGFNLNAAGQVTTNFTDTGNPATANFLGDGMLSTAITRLDQISVLLGQQRQLLAASKTAMASRLDLNQTMQKALNDTANAMTAADISQESANLASLRNRQSFAATGLSISQQAEQYLLNLLR